MKCGAKRFIVNLKVNEIAKRKIVTARTPAAARRLIRKEYGDDALIHSVRKKNRINVVGSYEKTPARL